MNWRSLLFVAAHDKKRLERAATRGADAIILDLEDGVAPECKEVARSGLGEVVEMIAAAGVPVVVRVNVAWRDRLKDLEFAIRPGVSALMVPKVEDAAELKVTAKISAEYAELAGLVSPPGLIALIESPAALTHLPAIASVENVIGLALGSEDFSLALGVMPTREALDLPCRQIAIAAAAHGQMALGIPHSIAALTNVDGWASSVHYARAIGITGALCIHPSQIESANQGFGVSGEEREQAARVIMAWEEAGRPAVLRFDGRMIDLPVLLAAQRVVAKSK